MDDDEVTIKLCSRGNFLGSQSVSGAQNWHQRGPVCKLNAISVGNFTYVKAYYHYIGSFDSSNQLYVFDVKTGKYRSFSFTNASIVSFCFLCSYADHIGIVFDDNSLCIFDWRTSSVLSTFRVPEATQSVDSIDNQHILLTLSSGKIVMVDLRYIEHLN